MSEFSPLVYVDLVYKPPPRVISRLVGARWQGWYWVAKSGTNGRVLSVASEHYTNREDAAHAIDLLFADRSNVYLREPEQSNHVLRMAVPL